MMPTQYGNPAGAGSRVRRMDREDSYLVHIQGQSDWLMHYGVKGQKWGVITKEYEPVAVDHRKLRTLNPISKIRAHYQKKDAVQAEKDQIEREQRQAWIEKRNKRFEIAGYAIAGTALVLSLYGGYKLSRIKPAGKKVLKSLLNAKFSKDERRTAGRDAFMLMDAKQRGSGMNRVKEVLGHAGSIATGQRYRRYLKRARGMVAKFKNSRAD